MHEVGKIFLGHFKDDLTRRSWKRLLDWSETEMEVGWDKVKERARCVNEGIISIKGYPGGTNNRDYIIYVNCKQDWGQDGTLRHTYTDLLSMEKMSLRTLRLLVTNPWPVLNPKYKCDGMIGKNEVSYLFVNQDFGQAIVGKWGKGMMRISEGSAGDRYVKRWGKWLGYVNCLLTLPDLFF